MHDYISSFALFFTLMNPFLLSLYLMDLISDLDIKTFLSVLVRGTMIAATVFVLFAWSGEKIFSEYLQVSFEAFQIFGGIVFLLIGIRFVFMGTEAIRGLRGSPEQLAGSIAMPFLIGPGTVSASVVIGTRHPVSVAALIIFATVMLSVALVMLLKFVHDVVRERNVRLIDRYVEVVGRVSALLVGTIAIDMILKGRASFLRRVL